MTTYTDAQRETIIAAVIEGLRAGTPLTVICSADGMPCDDTVRIWADGNEEMARAIARARETGFDTIASRIRATVRGKTAEEGGDSSGDVQRDKLIAEYDLKLLAKWDPKRYGDKTLVGSDPDNPLPQGFQVNLVKASDASPG